MSTFQYQPYDQIDWSNPSVKISEYFTVREAVYLPSWGISHIPSLVEKQNICELAKKLDKVRKLLNKPITVSCWMRPSSVNCPGSQHHGKSYNALVNGAKASAHIEGKAVDWTSAGVDCDDIRTLLKPHLEEYGLRCEDLPNSNWVHLDSRPPFNGNYFFKP